MDLLYRILDDRLRTTAERLARPPAPDREEIAPIADEQFVRALEGRDDLVRGLRQSVDTGEAADFLAGRMERYIWSRNPYAGLSGEERDQLVELYRRMVDEVLDAMESSLDPQALRKAIDSAALAHWDRLELHFAALGDHALLGDLRADAARPGPPASAYSVPLQARVLRLDTEQLAEPVLDLGSGPDGDLVRWLRSEGIEAWGLDRLAGRYEGAIRGDWLEVDLPAAQWGTVLSHLAFSLHFLNHHLRPSGWPERYARRYLEILGSLRPGGWFRYVPGLPFMEEHLDRDRYEVRREDLPGELDGLLEVKSRGHGDHGLPNGVFQVVTVRKVEKRG